MKHLRRVRAGAIGLTACAAVLLLCPRSALASNVSREVSGWYNDGWNAESHATYLSNEHIFSEVNPYWYDLAGTDGSISERAYAYTPQNVVDAHSYGDLVVPSMADHDQGQIDSIVGNPSARQNLIDNIVNTVNSRGYDGIDLNFESGGPSARVQFTAFVTALASALHHDGKRLEVTIKAAASATEESWYIFDYASLGASGVDRIKIMAYDNNFEAGANVPGPIAPISWIRSLLDYAITTRGVPSTKIQLGLHNYGWTWKKAGSAWQLLTPHDTYRDVQQKSAGIGWQWDVAARESWKQYSYGGKTYRSYVGTADTVAARVALADEFNLAGLALWVLGREDASIYTRMCTYFGASCTPSIHPVLLSQGKPATASSSFDDYYTAPKAVDGSINEGWLANPAETTSWLRVDLQASYNVSQVKIFWGRYDWPVSYDVQTSNDGISWTTAYHEANNADGGLDTIAIAPVPARYVRVVCNGPKSDGWSYEIYEVQVSGTPALSDFRG
ncbi:MAG TPA: glycosyl hydrolase family 18 protein [Labilithrix sp.]|nr:glycosyl hydrolase family 18 protein [Labilithrix sp.]